jgi:protein gp37
MIMTTAENQEMADLRLPILLQIPGVMHGVSLEPLLGPVDLTRWLKISWQCSGCREYFSGGYQKICPSCGREEYWSGSHAFNPPPGRDGFLRQTGPGLDLIALGGETGQHARPLHPDWPRQVRDQCQAAGVPFFFKSWGEWRQCDEPQETYSKKSGDFLTLPAEQCFKRVGKKAAGRTLDGRTWDQVPEVMG